MMAKADNIRMPEKYHLLPDDKFESFARQKYGFEILGSHIGSAEYMEIQMNKILDE